MPKSATSTHSQSMICAEPRNGISPRKHCRMIGYPVVVPVARSTRDSKGDFLLSEFTLTVDGKAYVSIMVAASETYTRPNLTTKLWAFPRWTPAYRLGGERSRGSWRDRGLQSREAFDGQEREAGTPLREALRRQPRPVPPRGDGR